MGEPVTEAGLHFKIPFIQEVNRIEKRFLPWDGPANEMSTKDKTYLIIDTFARWRISDPMQYFLRLRDERSALSRLNDILGSETRNAVAKHELIEIVRTTKDRVAKTDQSWLRELAKWEPCIPLELGWRKWSSRFSKMPPPSLRALESNCLTPALSGSITTKPCETDLRTYGE